MKIQIIAKNNYTCTSEQHILVQTWSGKNRPIDQELVHEIFDLTAAETIERRGGSGTGAGARVVIVDDEDIEISVESPNEALEVLGEIPVGSRMRAFKFRARIMNMQVWNGHNFITVYPEYIQDWLATSKPA